MTKMDKLQEIKKELYRYRNGIISESLKKLYGPDIVVFGLLIPQIKEIAAKYSKDIELGFQLWNEKNIRESRLLSMLIIPEEMLDKEKASNMIMEVRNNEEAELLPFFLLRHLPYATELYKELMGKDLSNPYSSYCLDMLKKNLSQS